MLRVERLGDLTFTHIRELVTDIVTVTEEQMLTAVRLALEARLVAEPGGAVAVAAALDGVDGIPQATPSALLSRCSPAATSVPNCWPRCWPGKTPPTLGSAMRTVLAYSSARILLLVASLGLLYLAGARGLILLGLAILVSALASYVLLSRQRDVMSMSLSRRMTKAEAKAAEFRSRLEDGAAAEDVDDDEQPPGSQRPAGPRPVPPATVTPS